MDKFTVPQFIEQKPKIVGPLTFQQFIYLGIAAGAGFIFYFTVPFYFFITGTLLVFSFAATLAFGRVAGRSLPLMFKNFLAFTLRPKIYLWRKKAAPPLKLIYVKKAEKTESPEIKKAPVPTIVGKSHLKDLSSQVEMRTR